MSTWSLLRPIVSGTLVPSGLRRMVRGWRARRVPVRPLGASLIAPAFAQRIDLAGRLRRLTDALASHARYSADGRAYSSIRSNYTTVGIERYGRVAARRGIEPRHPFLDRQLLEYCAWVPLALRKRDGYPKWALRRAMAAQLPAEVAWRRGKEHLGWRFNYALFGQLGEDLQRPDFGVDSPLRDYVDSNFAREIAGDAAGWPGADDRWELLLAASALNVWLDARGLFARRTL